MQNFANKLGLTVACFVFCMATPLMAQSPGILAQADAADDRSVFLWTLESLRLFGLLAVLAGIAVFVGSCVVVIAARRPAVIASYLVFLLFPLLFAVTGSLKGLVQ